MITPSLNTGARILRAAMPMPSCGTIVAATTAGFESPTVMHAAPVTVSRWGTAYQPGSYVSLLGPRPLPQPRTTRPRSQAANGGNQPGAFLKSMVWLARQAGSRTRGTYLFRVMEMPAPKGSPGSVIFAPHQHDHPKDAQPVGTESATAVFPNCRASARNHARTSPTPATPAHGKMARLTRDIVQTCRCWQGPAK